MINDKQYIYSDKKSAWFVEVQLCRIVKHFHELEMEKTYLLREKIINIKVNIFYKW